MSTALRIHRPLAAADQALRAAVVGGDTAARLAALERRVALLEARREPPRPQRPSPSFLNVLMPGERAAVNRIFSGVSATLGVPVTQMHARCRVRALVDARMIATVLASAAIASGPSALTRHLRVSHGLVHWRLRQHPLLIETCAEYRAKFQRCQTALKP